MFIDASALTAMATDEEAARELLARVQRSRTRITSPLAVWETTVAVMRIMEITLSRAQKAVDDLLDEATIVVEALPPQTAAVALDAFERYGKGRHKAKLNFGDCFSYACAKHFRQPLMFKGADFTLTDIDAA